ncbi:hypothetical protein VTK26DRAFT_8709 [Humicola hyalothermophila]
MDAVEKASKTHSINDMLRDVRENLESTKRLIDTAQGKGLASAPYIVKASFYKMLEAAVKRFAADAEFVIIEPDSNIEEDEWQLV